MLAHLQGEPVNSAKLGGNLEVDGKTIRHYMDILVDLLLVRRLEPWYANVNKRLVKSPRYYIRDSGIQHRLLGIHSYDALVSNPVMGKSWEGFVIENIHSILPRRAETYFYRTTAGAEIDLVVKLSATQIWAVEIKYGIAPKISKHFNQTCKDIKASKKYVIYGGNDEFSIGNQTIVISLSKFLQLLIKQFN
jgi:predicted AAA+ superfamily ATPase